MQQGNSCGGCGSGCGAKTHKCGCKQPKKKTMSVEVEGQTIDCHVLCVFECDEQGYIALQNKDSDRIYMYRYQELEEDVRLEAIEDQHELRMVGRLLIKNLETE